MAVALGRFAETMPARSPSPATARDLRHPVRVTATAGLVAATAALVWMVPANPLAHLDQPPHLAVLGYALTLITMAALAPLGARGHRHLRRALAGFLIGMPLVYLASWVLHGRGWWGLAVELAGLALYATLAALGQLRSFRLVVAGIAAHGLWDLAHYRQTDYIPDWYTLACALIDAALGLYLWTRPWTADTRDAAGGRRRR